MASSSQMKPTPTDKLWTPANIVTLVRICLVPLFVVALLSPWPQWFGLPQVADDSKSLIAAGIFILISCTDWLDGYLARSRGEVTDFGKFMDPLADKLLVCSAMICLIPSGKLAAWIVIVIIAREFIISGFRLVASDAGIVIAASYWGKFKTVSQMFMIIVLIADLGGAFDMIGTILIWVSLILTIVSLFDYVAKNVQVLTQGGM